MQDTIEIANKINNLLNKEHYTCEKICNLLKINDYQLRKIMKENNVKFTKEYPRFKRISSSSDEINKKIIEMTKEDISSTKIAKMLNISSNYVYDTLKKLGIKRKSKPIKWTNIMLQALLFTYQNYGTNAVMQRFGIKRHMVYINASMARKFKLKAKDNFLPAFDKK